MFVGDSLHFNQMLSMVCMVQSVIPPERKSFSYGSYTTVFKMEVIAISLFFISLIDSNNLRESKQREEVKNLLKS